MSLTMLGMCINARAGSATAHAPYRDSKLTRLLKARARVQPRCGRTAYRSSRWFMCRSGDGSQKAVLLDASLHAGGALML